MFRNGTWLYLSSLHGYLDIQHKELCSTVRLPSEMQVGIGENQADANNIETQQIMPNIMPKIRFCFFYFTTLTSTSFNLRFDPEGGGVANFVGTGYLFSPRARPVDLLAGIPKADYCFAFSWHVLTSGQLSQLTNYRHALCFLGNLS